MKYNVHIFMGIPVISFLLWMLSFAGYAQSEISDSLAIEGLFNRISEMEETSYWYMDSADASLRIRSMACQLAKRSGNDYLLQTSYRKLAKHFLWVENNRDSAQAYLNQAETLLTQKNDSSLLAEIYLEKGQTYLENSDFKTADSLLKKSAQIAIAQQDSITLYKSLVFQTVIIALVKEGEGILKLISFLIPALEKHKLYDFLCRTHSIHASLYYPYKPEKHISILQKAWPYMRYLKNENGKMELTIKMANAQLLLGNRVHDSIKTKLEEFKHSRDPYIAGNALVQIAYNKMTETNDYDAAIVDLENAILLFKQCKRIYPLREVYHLLSECYLYGRKDGKTSEYWKNLSNALSDSIQITPMEVELKQDMAYFYQSAFAAKLKEQAQAAETSKKQQSFVAWLLTICACLLGSTLYFILKKRKAKRKLLEIQAAHGNGVLVLPGSENGKETITHKLTAIILEKYQEEVDFSKITVNDVCLWVGMSETKLKQELKKASQVTPGKFLKETKLWMGKELLTKHSAKTVKEAAHKAGFSDVDYFSRLFKSHFGISPSELLKKESPTISPNEIG